MADNYLDTNSEVQDYKLRMRKLSVPFSIGSNATPASKTHSLPHLGDAIVLRTEGKTSDADSADDAASGSLATPDDDAAAGALFGVVCHNLGTVADIINLEVKEDKSEGQAATGALAATGFVTSNGNIAVNIQAPGADLSAEDLAGFLVVEYLVDGE